MDTERFVTTLGKLGNQISVRGDRLSLYPIDSTVSNKYDRSGGVHVQVDLHRAHPEIDDVQHKLESSDHV